MLRSAAGDRVVLPLSRAGEVLRAITEMLRSRDQGCGGSDPLGQLRLRRVSR